ncbi:protease HtpX [Acanthopleuribacter pedis]|uniref:Protease HtpX homolog n=1 Tax=Acanthopleuribacter pedis TaxID=442870 RepID=A0A8J7Q960_9BACT|nr:protease HtpX [Acanthopleuribacter pedis]MBO1319234.1 protease HtpX [Acanthopleuribacter pedis]
MFKRIGLFLLTNLLVVVTVGVIMNIVLPMLGIQVRGTTGIAIFCGIFGMSGAMISLFISRWVAKRTMGIHILPEGEPLQRMVATLAREAGIAVPEVGIYESPEPNAFATGPSKNSSLVAFSTGLLDQMNEREVEAVAAHEVSHVANGDMVTMALLTGVANAFVMFFARMVAMAIDTFLSDDEGGGLGFFGYIIVVFVLENVFMMLAYIPISWFSRQREYRADAGAARLTSPRSMAQALDALRNVTAADRVSGAMALQRISSPKRVSLWATHPTLEDRIERLNAM